VYELIESGKARWLVLAALSGALVLLSHNLVALIVAPALAVWAIVFLGQSDRSVQRGFLLGLAVCWAFGLAAFFTLPVLFEGDLVQLETLTRYPFHYSGNFASLRDLFFLRSSDYGFLLLARDEPPIQIGWFHWGVAALGVLAVAALFRGKRESPATVSGLFVLFFAIGVFMSISASEFVWDRFDALRFLQFPWRYLGLVSFAAAALAGATLLPLRQRPVQLQALGVAALVALFVGSGWTFFQPYESCDLSDAQVLGAQPLARTGSEVCDALIASPWSVAINDYLPKDVNGIPKAPSAPATVVDGEATIVSSEQGSHWLDIEIDASRPSTLDAAIFDFPNWRVRIDGKRVPHHGSTPYGLIEFPVPEGRHHVDLRLENTNVRRAGNFLSLVSWTALLLGAPAWWLGQRMKRGL
jgi:hypothetical protein